jgi:hypothetical protein
LPRFVALAILSGHGWLIAAGTLIVLGAPLTSGLLYDAALHALFLGFVLAMVFGHAPLVLPAVLATPIAFHAGFYLPLVVLELSLAARVAGDLGGAVVLARAGGLGNAIAILLFVASVLVGVTRGRAGRDG